MDISQSRAQALSSHLFKVRIWEMAFQVFKSIPSLPQPYIAVLEKEDSPAYHISSSARYSGDTAMLRVTLKGEGVFRNGKQFFPLPPGKAYFIMDRMPDASYYYPSHATEPWVFLWFGIKGDCVPAMVADITARYGEVFDLPLDSRVVKYIESMKGQKSKEFQILSPMAGAKMVMDVLAGIGDVLDRPDLESPEVKLAKTAQELILSSLESDFSIAELASKMEVSREHLSRVFKEQTGMPPLEFLCEERMKLAFRTLLGSRISCKELASRLGYESPSSFTRAFKRRFGISPVKGRS